jgi:uncharacterized membrane protein
MKKITLYIMAILYIAAGIYHFVNPDFYLKLMPDFLPAHLPLVYFSGVVEILLGALLVPTNTRHISIWLIIAMLVVFFFAIHIPMTINFYKTNDPGLLVSIIRLPIQFLLIWWALMYKQKQNEI